MAYDLLVKNGWIIDGSGMPACVGDVAVRHGKIVEMGKLSGSAARTIDATGLVIAPGFIDNHCHYDAQVLWDPLCSFSCYHGSTTVIFGNCSPGLAPVRAADRERLAGMLSYVEAIPINMHNCQTFRGLTHWHPVLLGTDEEKMRAYSDPQVRQKLRADLDALGDTNAVFSKRWDLMVIEAPQLSQHQSRRGKTVAQIAAEQGKDPLDAFLDLAVAEHLDTVFVLTEINVEPEAVAEILTSPYTIVGLSDGGAHVQFDSGVAFSTRLLGYWVREQGIMSLEEAIRQITFVSASAFGIYDRGLLRPGMAADLVLFDAEAIRPLPEDIVHDFPNNGWRIRERAEGIAYTIVNGTVLMEQGQPTGALPGKVLRNALYMAS